MIKCISCNKESSDSVKFPCPKCGYEIIRCNQCRNLSIEYKCPKCGHVFDNVTTVPFKCSTCTADLNNVSTLIPEANQDMRVKFFVNGAL